jgi:hypothetical protein
MIWEALLNWVWSIYYLFLFATIGTAIFSVIKRQKKGLSIVSYCNVCYRADSKFYKSIGRTERMNWSI